MGLWLYHNCCGILHKIPSAYYYRSGRLNIVKNLVERKQCNMFTTMHAHSLLYWMDSSSLSLCVSYPYKSNNNNYSAWFTQRKAGLFSLFQKNNYLF